MKTKSKRLWIAAIVSFFSLVVLIGGCKKDDYVEIVGVCPVVESTNPVNGATAVPLNQIVTATFNEEMNPVTITQQSFTLQSGAKSGVPVTGTLTYNNTNATLSFVPSDPLTENTTYTGTVKSSIKDLNGNALQTNFVWTFSTGSILSPTVISTDPANLATGVFINKVVTASFSTPMDPLTITGTTFTLKQGTTLIAGTVSYAGIIASFTPGSDLIPNTEYTGTITSGAKNLAGTALESNYVWSFTTGSISGPTVISTDPTSNATGVLLNKKVTATFSMAMDPLTITTATFLVKKGLTTIAGTVSYSGTTASFNPTSLFEANTLYVCTITSSAKNVAGIQLSADYVWSFTTGTTKAPTVISTIPISNATGVLLNSTVTATFSEPMDPLTVTAATFTLTQGIIPVSGVVTYSGTTASFVPAVPLLPNTVYTAIVTTGVMNVAGIPMANNYGWTFTTLSTSAPAVILTDPLNNATAVELNKDVTASFNMQMDPLTLNSATFTLYNGIIPVAGNVTYAGTLATFNPADDLLPTTTYTATITSGAMNPSGIPLVSDYVWSFTTLTTVVPPTIILGTAAAFGAFGGNAGVTNQGVNTVVNGGIATTAASTLVTGFHDGMTGDVYTETPLNVGLVTNGIFTAPPFPGTATSEAIATLALVDANAAYLSISPASMPGGIDPGAGELGGLTLAPGIYKSASGTFKISNGPLTLDAQGDPNATWVFQTASGLTVGIAGPTGARSIVLINGALPKNVFWYVGSAATINGAGGGIMVGTIIATAGVTFSTPGNAVQTVLNGRALSLVASVTMVNTTINVPE